MIRKGFAYFDKYGTLHVTESKKTAHEYGEGKYVEVELNYEGGYPKTDKGENILVYDYGKEIRIGNRKNENSRIVDPSEVPHIAEIIKKLTK